MSDKMSAEDSWNERFICTEFLFSKNRQYKAVDLNFHERQHVEKYPVIDVLQIDCNKIKLDNKFRIHYDNCLCNIGVRNFDADIIKGHHLKRNVYLQIMSIGLSYSIWKIFVTIMNLMNKKNKQLNLFADSILVSINCDMKLPLNRIACFNDAIIRFDHVNEVCYRGKTFCKCLYL